MADPVSLTTGIPTLLSKLVKAIRESQRSNSALASSTLRESRQKVEVVLETSRQKFQVWEETWLDAPDRAISPETLWGDGGWSDIKNLLGCVRGNAQEIENELAKNNDSIQHAGWRELLPTWWTKKNPTLIVKRPPLSDLAVQLSRSIDELWAYSEVAFDSLHGILSHQIGPPRRERLLKRSLEARTGSLALYGACTRSKADYSLEVDLLGGYHQTPDIVRKRTSVSSMIPSGLFYRLFAQNSEASNVVNEITVECISRPGDIDLTISKVVEFDARRSDVADHGSWPSLNEEPALISIHPEKADAPSFFRIPRLPVELRCEGDPESLVQLLYKDRIERDSKELPLSQTARVQLAFKVVECGFYLLGTPWLASLSSKRLRMMKISERSLFVLQVQTLDLEDLYFEDPDALSERSQLFLIGIVLVEIALSDERNPHNIRDPDLRKSKILPLVERSMGALYCGATAFCLADRRSAPHFGRPEKYVSPERKAWMPYLAELLEDYHAQVFSRSA